MRDIIVLYHANCTDGFGSAYAAWKHFGDKAEYIPVAYGDNLPDVTGKDVYMLDYSCKREVAKGIATIAKCLTIIDHHKTAYEDLQDLMDSGVINGIFDMNKSGAVLTWEWFHGEDDIPALFLYLQDYDLWRFYLRNTKAIVAGLRSYEMNFEVWSKYAESLANLVKLSSEGESILRNHMQLVKSAAENARRIILCGFDVPCVNANGFLASDLGALLAEGEAFSVTYYIDAKGGERVSLRSEEGGADVSEIAKEMGGGGHKHAAGYVNRSLRLRV